jgi:mannose-6-phosphate isomerase-like protein (cupin superfamily)
MPANLPFVSPNLMFCERCPPCIHAAFQDIDLNPLLVLCSSDERGDLAVFEFRHTHPYLIEVIHTRPQLVRGNHRHRRCSELLTVLSGALDMYLLCVCPGKHVFRKRMERGDSVYLPPGTAHAFHTLSELALSSIFIDGDPRLDRERVELIYL